MGVLIYRVENENGIGMYSSDMSNSMFEVDSRHPPPGGDDKLGSEWWKKILDDEGNRTEGRFGFASLEQLRFWIYREEWRRELKDEGFAVSVYEVPQDKCLIGDTQAIFAWNYRALSHRLDMLEV